MKTLALCLAVLSLALMSLAAPDGMAKLETPGPGFSAAERSPGWSPAGAEKSFGTVNLARELQAKALGIDFSQMIYVRTYGGLPPAWSEN
ncbi:MAG TPA: hypothetical protein VLS90_19590 [Thermodesulfobacteriota bacterium]|nr:hypothetical protein [Thermodesulfobacteriota bacterium]